MAAKKLLLRFPKNEVEKPILYHLVKDYNIRINIFRAKITPEEEGFIILEVIGDEENINSSIEFIRKHDVIVTISGKGLQRDEVKCVHCGNCLSHCPSEALFISNAKTREVGFKETLCIECLNCVKNCPFNACTALF